jgi:putative DNA primase/helicase
MSDETRHYCDEVLAEAGIEPAADPREALISQLARMNELGYQTRRAESAARLGIRVSILDKEVRKARARSKDEQAALPHWNAEPWDDSVPGGELLDDIKRAFEKYIVLPKGAGVAFALWTLHAWTVDAGDISPFLVLVSPTKRCGKTSALIVLYYLTPRSELASNISASALFPYVEDVRPTLLIDEADSFIKDNEELRGILNSGHTKAAAHVIRNVEVNGEHKPRRFSTWAPKAIATIRALADTLEDRAIVVQLQRKPKAASVARLRKRDSDEFGILRRKAARWAEDNFAKLKDPDPAIPEPLNDRAADNWRPLLAIADLAGGEWPSRARDAACLLSGEGHDSISLNVELLTDIRVAFDEDEVGEEIRSATLVEKLTADPERPWAEWNHKHGKPSPLTQRQLAGLLKPFGIISEEVHPLGQSHGKGYKRVRFEEAWEAYLPGQNTLAPQNPPFDPRERASADEMGTSNDFRSAQEDNSRGSKNDDLSLFHAGLRACADLNPGNGDASNSDHGLEPSSAPESRPWEERQISASPEDRRPAGECCAQCHGPVDGKERPVAIEGRTVWLHPECERFYRDLAIPAFLRRTNGANAPAVGPPGDSLDDFQ